MKAIKPYAEIMTDINGHDVLKKIELVGRTCYKSEDKITDDSASTFVSNLIKRGHEAMLEHASFCFELPQNAWFDLSIWCGGAELEDGFKCFLRFTNDNRHLVSGNVRAWRNFAKVFCKNNGFLPHFLKQFFQDFPVLFPEFQNDNVFSRYELVEMVPVYVEDLKTENEVMTHCDMTVKFIVDRGVSHELVRHRTASFAQESTRYCNYGKDTFGNQLTFIIPEFFKFGSDEWHLWKTQMESVEQLYMEMIERGVTPEKARTILPNSLKTEIIMTANAAEWVHFFELRACNKTGKAHPQMLEVTRPLLDEFKETMAVIFDGLSYE